MKLLVIWGIVALFATLRGMKRAIQILILALSLFAAGCGGGAESDVETELDELSSLPYVGFMQGDDDDGEGYLYVDHLKAAPGYTLYTVQMLSLAELIDEDGVVVRSWRYEPSARWERATLLSNGDLLVVGAGKPATEVAGIPDDSRYLLRFDWEGNLLWKRSMTAHHDVEPMPDGNISVLTFERRHFPTIHPDIDVRDDLLTVVDAEGRELESLSMLDTVANSDEEFPLRETIPNTLGVEPWVDLFHLNSIEWMDRADLEGRHPLYNVGNVLLCSRHQNRVMVVDPEAKKIVWSWGIGELLGPHDATLLDDGNILVFDNGLGRGYSRVIEIDPLSGEIVWEYSSMNPEDFYTISKGSSQRLPNGNTLIANSDRGKAFEVDLEGEIVWALKCPHTDGEGRRAAIVRCYRYSPEFVDSIVASVD